MTSEDSPYFEIVSPVNCAHKVGAGLPTTYKVLFTPDDRKVTFHVCLVFCFVVAFN